MSSPMRADSCGPVFWLESLRIHSFHVYFTSSAVIVPLSPWNFTFGRSLNVQVLPSSETFHDSASIGAYWPSWLRVISESDICLSGASVSPPDCDGAHVWAPVVFIATVRVPDGPPFSAGLPSP